MIYLWITLITAIQTVVIELIRRGASKSGQEKIVAGVSAALAPLPPAAPILPPAPSEEFPTNPNGKSKS
jgi:hypothetical protein